jgi:GT2 family glycosyltransferase
LNGRYPRSLYEGEQPFPIDHPLGAAMCVRREAIEQAGLLDENYHMYVEEVDWSKRIVSAGWQAYCVPQAVVTHLGGQSTGQIKTDMFITLWASRCRFYQKHYSKLKVWPARQIVALGMRRRAKQDTAAAGRDELTQAELAERLACYQTVVNTWQGKTI